MKDDKLPVFAEKAPQIENLAKITPEQAAQYVKFVAELRKVQNRWFRLRDFAALELSRQMERELDSLNEQLLTPNLFNV